MVVAASQGLYAVCVGDVDMQNEVVAQGGLGMVEHLAAAGGPVRVHALWLLCCLLHGNSYVKNAARTSGGLVRALVGVLRRHAAEPQDLTVRCLFACLPCRRGGLVGWGGRASHVRTHRALLGTVCPPGRWRAGAVQRSAVVRFEPPWV